MMVDTRDRSKPAKKELVATNPNHKNKNVVRMKPRRDPGTGPVVKGQPWGRHKWVKKNVSAGRYT